MKPLQRFAQASNRYLPDPIHLLFIAEAPPALRVRRFFYFTGLTNGDTLFLEMMKVLYPAEVGFAGESFQPRFSVQQMRHNKANLLRRFQADGYVLIDACEQPMPDRATTPTKMQRMKSTLPALQQRLERLLSQPEIPIILIGGVTYAVCAAPLRHNGWKILNQSMINHPARGNQLLFREKLSATLQRGRYITRGQSSSR
jgi:hypothetical protein